MNSATGTGPSRLPADAGGPIVVRPARPDDAGAIASVHIASWRASYGEVLPGHYLASLDPVRWTERWRAAVALPEAAVWVAAAADSVVGFAAVGPSRDADLAPADWFQLYNFHVAPDHRGNGLGAALWRAAVEPARAAFRGLTLWVVPANQGARRFYRRAGLRSDGTRRTETLGPGVELPEMRYRVDWRRAGRPAVR